MSHPLHAALAARAGDACELCGATTDLDVFEVPPVRDDEAHALLACLTCRDQLQGSVPLDTKHWFCLQEVAWSDVPAIQAVAWRTLGKLGESWATDLRDQLYLPDDLKGWITAGGADAGPPTLDSNGTPLAEGDNVTLIKDLDVKGTQFVAKRGTTVKGIRLIPGDPDNIEGRVNKTTLVLKTIFLKKLT